MTVDETTALQMILDALPGSQIVERAEPDHLTAGLLDLMEHEKVIEQGLATFLEVGWALLRIRDGRKYRAAGYATFEAYCRGRWDWSREHGRRLMRAAETAALMPPRGGIPEPTSEKQLRPLAPIRDDPEAMKTAWEQAVDSAGGGQPTAAQVAEAVEVVRQPQPVKKPGRGGTPHPAVFSDPILDVIADLLAVHRHVLDPFAGTGRIHALAERGWDTVGVEIEPEWAAMHPRTRVGNALTLDFDDAAFDAVATSPTYGNRLADHHRAFDPEARRSYAHDLGRDLHHDNSGALQWGDTYRSFHRDAWAEAARILRPGGRFVLNVKDHIRKGVWVDVAGWHIRTLSELGLVVVAVRPVPTDSYHLGANHDRRAPAELVIALDKP
jgi:SAM-dependent methyltransferase